MSKLKLGKYIRILGRMIKFLFSRVGLFYIVIAVASMYLFNTLDILDRGKAEELNEIMPSFGYLNSFNEKQGAFNQEYLDSYIAYYEKVNEFLPNQADVYSMLGYCYYHANDLEKAISFYNRAIEVNPHVFWFSYNLGVIYYKQGNYAQAVKSLQAAMDRRPEHALAFVGYSRVYRRIAHGVKNYKNALEERVQVGYGDCLALLVLSNYQLGNYNQSFYVATYAPQVTKYYKNFFYYYAGMSTFKLKQFSKSAYFLKEFLKDDPYHRDALVHLAMSFKYLGVNKLAEISMQKAIMVGEGKNKPLLSGSDIFVKMF